MSEKSPKKSYNQYCALAKALDVVGERWTLLMMRDLISGPKRFQDLLEGLPGIGTNLLTDRLKDLEKRGFIQKKTLAPPARAQAYEITKLGIGLGPVLTELARWGYQFLGDPKKKEFFRPHWALTFLTANFDRKAAQGIERHYKFCIGEETFHVIVKDGRVSIHPGSLPNASLVLTTDPEDFLEVISKRLPFQEALRRKKIRMGGDTSSLNVFLSIFGSPSHTNPSTWVLK